MNDSIKDMQKDIGYINKAISDLLNDFANRNNCHVDVEITSRDVLVKNGIIRSHNVKITAIYG